MRAEQIAIAMDIRGFTSPNQHRVQWHQFHLQRIDWFVLLSLLPFWWARLMLG
jgi:energy-coupling factor transport system permease protein